MLTAEWRHRIERWMEELPRHFYRPLGQFELQGFITKKHIDIEQAAKMKFNPMPEGTYWGAIWEYGWFRGNVRIPEDICGKRIVTKIDTGRESLVFINEKACGAIDRKHKEITLSTDSIPGSEYEILVESYAGNGEKIVHPGPVPPERVAVPDPPDKQGRIGENSFGIWEEEAYQLWIDIEILFQLRGNIDQNSLRVAEIDRALMDFTLIVDYELPYEDRFETFKIARKRLKPLMHCQNGSTVPSMCVFGHAHLDVAWLWPLAETERKCARTFSTQLSLIEEYPEYKFLQSQPHLYQMLKIRYPDIYDKVKAEVDKGSIVPEGGMWLEADTVVTGGESLIRQFIYGKRFFKEEFGVDSKILWLPDVFGYSAVLPQIMLGCGVKYFSSSKIFWAYYGGEPFPFNTFLWEGIDGSRVLVHLCTSSNTTGMNVETIINRWNNRVQKNNISDRMIPFGIGDGGGGPSRDHIEVVRRTENLEGVPKTRMCTPLEFFKNLEEQGTPSARYVGEMYFQAHRGIYTSQAKTKRGNRKSEFALRETEMWGTIAKNIKGFEFSAQTMEKEWKQVLLNQFHDIIPGTSIKRVHDEAEEGYRKVIESAENTMRKAALSLTDSSEKSISVFNSLSYERKVLVELPEGMHGAVDASGNTCPVQKVREDILAEVTVPPCGWTTLYCSKVKKLNTEVKATQNTLENKYMKIKLNDRGEICSILDKRNFIELTSGCCNSFKMYKDVPSRNDAWDINSMYDQTPVELDSKADFEIVANGPVMASVRVRGKLNDSYLTQDIKIYHNSRRIDFVTTIDWKEDHKLLKVNFPVNYYSDESVQEIQFGYVKRPVHKSRQYDADRFEVYNQKWTAIMEEAGGAAVINDSKYGVNVADSSINLTLLKSPLAPDMYADRGKQEFTYSLYTWDGSFLKSNIIHEAYDINCPVLTVPGGAGEMSVFSVNNLNVIIDSVKPAEDGSDDVIIRLYESKKSKSRCTLTTGLSFSGAVQTDMLENYQKDLEISKNKISLDFKPFEIKTVRLKTGCRK